MLKQWIKKIVFAGYVDEKKAEVRKQILFSSLFSLVALVLLILFGIDSFFAGRKLLATILFFVALINFCNYLYLRKSGNAKLSSTVIVFIMVLLSLYLLSSGGTKNTGPVWLLILPSLIFFVFGLWRGLISLLLFYFSVVLVLFTPGDLFLLTEYSNDYIFRFLGAFLAVSVISFIHEYTREDGKRELIELSRKLDTLSRKDDLTELSNRRDIMETIRAEISRFERSGHNFTILIGDIDDFKKINDTYGHQCGDMVLKNIACVLSENTQKRDAVARWGGEEFLIFLPETGLVGAEKTAERLREAIEKLNLNYEGYIVQSTISIGIADYERCRSLNQLIRNADKNLYQAKHTGKNRVVSNLQN